MQTDIQDRDHTTAFNGNSNSNSAGEGTGEHEHVFLSTVDENSPENVQELDQDWDLQSPLLQREFDNQERIRQPTLSSTSLGNMESSAESAQVHIDPWRLLSTTCSATTWMLFSGLVTGSYFYPWSDTKVRMKMDTVKTFPVDFQVIVAFNDYGVSHGNIINHCAVHLDDLSTFPLPPFKLNQLSELVG
eukprot:scaffold838_cov218-Chaetoceros_neogracile.AAC.21